MRGERGQVTAFVLIGLVVLIVFIIILLLRNSLREPGGDEQFSEYDKAAVKGHVDHCIDLVAEDAFKRVGSSGGLLKSLTGTSLVTAETDHLLGKEMALGLLLDPPHYWNHLLAPDYPWPDTPIDDLRALPPQALHNSGPFGTSVLPDLCNETGPNERNASNPNFQCAVPLLGQGTVQEALNTFIEERLTNCVDPSTLSNLLGADVTVGDIKAEVLFTRTGTDVDVVLPLTFRHDAVLKVSSFSRQYQVRMHETWLFARYLLNHAAKDPHFRFDDTSTWDPVWDPTLADFQSFTVYQQRQIGDVGPVLNVSILDAQSTVKKEPWRLSFVIPNRAPVLDYTPVQSVLQSPPGTPLHNLPRSASVFAAEPDGDPVTFTVQPLAGWTPDHLFVQPTTPVAMYEIFIVVGADVPGSYTARLTVTDAAGASDYQDIQIVVTPPP